MVIPLDHKNKPETIFKQIKKAPIYLKMRALKVLKQKLIMTAKPGLY